MKQCRTIPKLGLRPEQLIFVCPSCKEVEAKELRNWHKVRYSAHSNSAVAVPAREEPWRGVQMTSRQTTERKGELRHDARKRDSVVPRNTSLIRYSLVRCAPAERRKRATL
jgi:hypothetical protein